MKKIFYKNLNAEDKKIIDDNKQYNTFPSGTYFHKFISAQVKLSIGEVLCRFEHVYDGGLPCGSNLSYRLKEEVGADS